MTAPPVVLVNAQTIPFIAMLRKAVIMPKYAILFTICSAIAGQAIGARLERRRIEAAAREELTGLARATLASRAPSAHAGSRAARGTLQPAPIPVASMLLSSSPAQLGPVVAAGQGGPCSWAPAAARSSASPADSSQDQASASGSNSSSGHGGESTGRRSPCAERPSGGADGCAAQFRLRVRSGGRRLVGPISASRGCAALRQPVAMAPVPQAVSA
jgi:hypothetical protein